MKNTTTPKTKSTLKDNFIYYFAFCMLALVGGCLALMCFVYIPESNKAVLNTSFGIIISTCLVTIVGYFFGSSAGSKEKSDVINNKVK